MRFAASCVGAAFAALLSAGAPAAQEWPSRPVKLIVPYAAGGITDIMARVSADKLATRLSQPVIIENRPGAGGAIGTEYAIHQPPDGYALYFGAGAQITVQPFTQRLNYDPVAQLAPIGVVGTNGFICGLHPSVPGTTLASFIAYAKAHPGKVNYGITGIGTISHLVPAALNARAGLDMVQVPYQSATLAMSDLLAGTIQVYCTSSSNLLAYADGSKLKLLAISTEKRLPDYPDLPTFAETFPGFVFVGWNGYFAPLRTPSSVIGRMAKELAEIARDQSVIKRFADLGIETTAIGPAETAAIIKREVPMYREVVAAAGVQVK